MTSKTTDTYDVYDDHVIVHSKSGNTYMINDKLECTCVGYGYRQTCRHVDEAIKLGYMPSRQVESYTPDETQANIMHQLLHGNKK